MTDLVSRLRELANHRAKIASRRPHEMEEWKAAKEISELREALKPATEIVETLDRHLSDDWVPVQTSVVKALQTALAKLEGSDG